MGAKLRIRKDQDSKQLTNQESINCVTANTAITENTRQLFKSSHFTLSELPASATKQVCFYWASNDITFDILFTIFLLNKKPPFTKHSGSNPPFTVLPWFLYNFLHALSIFLNFVYFSNCFYHDHCSLRLFVCKLSNCNCYK